jgi:hypothetical protein
VPWLDFHDRNSTNGPPSLILDVPIIEIGLMHRTAHQAASQSEIGFDAAAIIREPASPRLLQTASYKNRRYTDDVVSVSFSPDGRRIFSRAKDGGDSHSELKVWGAHPQPAWGGPGAK